MRALISGFCKIGDNKVLKKNLDKNKLFSIIEAFGNLFETNWKIILQTHLIA